jgi:hypothetical protein
METEKSVNAKILYITMTIRERYPELSKYIEEMNVTLPTDKHPDLALRDLQAYYSSLEAMLNKYKLDQRNKLTCE